MGLDITIIQRTTIRCPHCGEAVGARDVREAHSGGKVWYPFLESIGYYVPYDKVTPDTDWYGRDMQLTNEQAQYLFRFCQDEKPYNCQEIVNLIASACFDFDEVVINADW